MASPRGCASKSRGIDDHSLLRARDCADDGEHVRAGQNNRTTDRQNDAKCLIARNIELVEALLDVAGRMPPAIDTHRMANDGVEGSAADALGEHVAELASHHAGELGPVAVRNDTRKTLKVLATRVHHKHDVAMAGTENVSV